MITTIVVTFNPDIPLLLRCIRSIYFQVDKIVVVNNGTNDITDLMKLFSNEKIVFRNLGKNYGIAFAQNRGIEEAEHFSTDWILFSDQDTVYPEDYVSKMLGIAKEANLEAVGALTPIFYDEVKKQYSTIMIGKTKAILPEKNKIYQITHSISSGTIVPLEVIKKCGGMREELFIDFVDFEWCWRVISQKYKIYCLSEVEIHHKLGDKLEKRFGVKIVSRSLFRFYYIIRNGYYLLTTDYLKKSDRRFFHLLMWKKILEVLILNYFSKNACFIVSQAVKNGKNKILKTYEELEISC